MYWIKIDKEFSPKPSEKGVKAKITTKGKICITGSPYTELPNGSPIIAGNFTGTFDAAKDHLCRNLKSSFHRQDYRKQGWKFAINFFPENSKKKFKISGIVYRLSNTFWFF